VFRGPHEAATLHDCGVNDQNGGTFMKQTFPFGQEVVWEPRQEWIASSNLSRFMSKHGIGSYDELLARSTNDIAWFWDAVIQDLDVRFYKPYTEVVDLSGGPMFPKWCVGGEMNIVHNLLDKWQEGPVKDLAALRWEGEEGDVRILSYGVLNREVCRCANALKSLGIGRGDVVGLFMPMTPELVIAFLAVI